MAPKSRLSGLKSNLRLQRSLENLYISPLDSCNLRCRYCYTAKTKSTLSSRQILGFIDRYSRFIHNSYLINLKSVIFCGGEVFTLTDFPRLVNQLLSQKIFITIITNGTLDRLDEIDHPQNCQLIVSIDGPKSIHDHNRGAGNFAKSLKFIQHAQNLRYPTSIFYLVTKDSYPFVKSFKLLDLPITYLTDRLGSLTAGQILDIKRHYPTFPAKNFGCFQLSLAANGQIYGCCESTLPLASISDPVSKIIDSFTSSLNQCWPCPLYEDEVNHLSDYRNHNFLKPFGVSTSTAKKTAKRHQLCRACCQPDFLCAYIKELKVASCRLVVKLL